MPTCTIPWYRSCRYALAAISFFGFIHVYAQRVGISVAIVCMVNQTSVRMNMLQDQAHGYDNHSDVTIVVDNSTSTCALWMTGGEGEGFDVGGN